MIIVYMGKTACIGTNPFFLGLIYEDYYHATTLYHSLLILELSGYVDVNFFYIFWGLIWTDRTFSILFAVGGCCCPGLDQDGCTK